MGTSELDALMAVAEDAMVRLLDTYEDGVVDTLCELSRCDVEDDGSS